jgi:galactan 5-O-arabinofuranosyltransferase
VTSGGRTHANAVDPAVASRGHDTHVRPSYAVRSSVTRAVAPHAWVRAAATTSGGAVAGWLGALLVGRAIAERGELWLLVAVAAAAVVGCLGVADRSVPRGAAALAFTGAFVAVLPYERALGDSVWAWRGLSGDQTFRTEYLTRLTDSPALADYTYQHLPAFYPPGWFWVVGRVAHLTDTPAWALMRPATTFTVVVMVVAGTLMAVGRLGLRAATGSAALAASFGTATLWEPYSLLAGFVVFAVLVRVPDLLASRSRPRSVLWLATAFATVFLCYTYGAAILAVACLVLAVGRRPRIRRLLVMCGAGVLALLTTAWYWVPAVTADRGHAPPAQMTWLSSDNTSMPLRLFLPHDPGSSMALVGLVWVLVVGWRTPYGRSVLTFLGIGWLWCAASVTLSHVADVQLQPNRVGELMALVCCACSALAVRDSWPWWLARWRRLEPALTRRGRLVVVAAAATVLAGGLAATSHAWAAQRDLPQALAARRTGPPSDALRVVSTLRQMLGRPADRIVVVSSRSDVLATSSLRGFQQWNETYANPAAQFRDRERYLRDTLAADTPSRLAQRLRTTPWGPIDAFVLTDYGGRSLYYTYIDQDSSHHTAYRAVPIRRSLVEDASFRVRDLGDTVVVVPRPVVDE